MSWVLHTFPLIAVIAYLLSTFYYLGLLSRVAESVANARAKRFLILGVICHFVFLSTEAFGFFEPAGNRQSGSSMFGFPLTLSLLSLLVVTVFLFFERRLQVSILGGFVASIALLLMLFSSVLLHMERKVNVVYNGGFLLWVHIACAVLANALFILLFSVSIVVILQEKLLKERKGEFFRWKLPSLHSLDQVSGVLLSWGFFLMLFGTSTGFIFAYLNQVSFFSFDSRVLWSMLTLAIYALLLFARLSHGWRGRRAAWLAVFGFSTLVASFVGTQVSGGSFHVY